MRRTAILGILGILAIHAGCQSVPEQKPIDPPKERPGDFSVVLVSQSWPTPAPDLSVTIWGDGTAEYDILFKVPHPGRANGSFEVAPEDLDRIYAAVVASRFFSMKPEYIANPPIPGRGVDVLTISAGGVTREVRSEYSKTLDLDLIRAEVMKVLPPEAYQGVSKSPRDDRYVGDKTTRLFYAPGSPEIEDIPEENRVYFQNPYDALNASFHPAGASDPFPK
jgi:hypothetical protein